MHAGLTEIFGHSFFVNNSQAVIGFDACTVYNITTHGDGNTPFVYSPDLSTLWVTSSSFVNIQNTYTTSDGGCFYLGAAANLSISRSQFISCGAGRNGGVGFVGNLNYINARTGTVVEHCIFSNCSAGNYGGVLQIQSNWNWNLNTNITVSNTSCIDCSCRGQYGGVLYFNGGQVGGPYNGEWISAVLNECSFVRCGAVGQNSRGGVLYATWYCETIVARCTFINCTAVHGGAVDVNYNSNLTVTDSVFIGDIARNGSDLSVDQQSSLLVDNSYSDAPNALFCNATSTNCTARLLTEDTYRNSTCGETFSAGTQDINGTCLMPCAAFGLTCEKPDECPEGYLALTGLCIPQCAYWAPVVTEIENEDGTNTTSVSCDALCALSEDLGAPLCYSDCPTREPDLSNSAEYPCGSSNCYYDEIKGTCNAACVSDGVHDGTVTDGVCVLLPCTDRSKTTNPSPSNPYPCGSSDCYYDAAAPTGQQCVTACPSDAIHTGGTDGNGACAVKACGERTPQLDGNGEVVDGQAPCGKDCFYDGTASSSSQCLEACFPAHYSEDASTGLCILKDCPLRFWNSSSAFPCATADCFFDATAPLNQQCVSKCPEKDAMHTGEVSTENGTCLLVACDGRIYNRTAKYPCGSSDCFYDESAAGDAGNLCVNTCPEDSTHSGETVNGVCVLKFCAERTANASAKYPCGTQDCFYDPTAPNVAGMQCVTVCTENLHRSGQTDSDGGACSLKACPDRLRNSSTVFPCGSAECFYDPGAPPVAGQQCGLACDAESAYSLADREKGQCMKEDKPSDRGGVDVNGGKEKLSKGAIVGIVLGAVALLVAIIAVIVIVVVVVRKNKSDEYEPVPEEGVN